MKPLRIALTIDPYLPVPPPRYGGSERVVDFLVRGLTARGHEVTLFAHPESTVGADLVPYGTPPHWGLGPRAREVWDVGSGLWRRRGRFDLVHSFGRLAALVPVLPLRRLPKIQSYYRDAIPWRSVKIAVLLAGASIRFTGCSGSVYRERETRGAGAGTWSTVWNGITLDPYTANPTVAADAPLVFLGRLEPIKGVHHAIAIAKAAGRRLVIAGNRVESGSARGYFEREIEPLLSSADIEYAGEVDDEQKNALLGSAAALLMPIEWEEPFGVVLIEAMACGTPVIGFPRGGLTEIVRSGVNGFLANDVAEAAQAVGRLDTIDRVAVRADCETRFADHVIVDAYEGLYGEMLERVAS